MTNLPRIFGDNGVFVEPDERTVANLDQPTRERLNAVRAAFQHFKHTEAAEQRAMDEVNNAMDAVRDAEEFARKNFPPSTFYDEWKAATRRR